MPGDAVASAPGAAKSRAIVSCWLTPGAEAATVYDGLAFANPAFLFVVPAGNDARIQRRPRPHGPGGGGRVRFRRCQSGFRGITLPKAGFVISGNSSRFESTHTAFAPSLSRLKPSISLCAIRGSCIL
jgi:hypothetical protein